MTEAAGYCHNRGFAAARQGDLPTALAFCSKRPTGVAGPSVCSRRSRPRTGPECSRPPASLREARQVAQEGLAQLRGAATNPISAEGLVLLSE